MTKNHNKVKSFLIFACLLGFMIALYLISFLKISSFNCIIVFLIMDMIMINAILAIIIIFSLSQSDILKSYKHWGYFDTYIKWCTYTILLIIASVILFSKFIILPISLSILAFSQFILLSFIALKMIRKF